MGTRGIRTGYTEDVAELPSSRADGGSAAGSRLGGPGAPGGPAGPGGSPRPAGPAGSLRAEQVHFPRPSDSKKLVAFEWTPIRYRSIISVLKNPFYAGVYAYGSSPAYPTSTWSSANYWIDVLFTSP